jgi:methylenetetrahydrofolate--tRNA-(uracil-5-)-methyltransferase
VGLLKEEMRLLDSLIIAAANATKVPAGGALAVDRGQFSAYIGEKLANHPLITIIREEVKAIPDGLAVIAAGPLASDALTKAIINLTGEEQLFFHDAIAPVIAADSIDMEKAFFASRYGKGSDDYLNCPMTEAEYDAFYEALIAAELYPLKDFEEEKSFSGCMPIETMAHQGRDTIRFGPLKPVGLELANGSLAHAVVQLRQDDATASMYNMDGFQTRLRRGEQERVFRLIPALEHAEFLRYGQMHRNTYINSPRLLNADLTLKKRGDLLFAGQITGVEGYVESAACGLAAGINAARIAKEEETVIFPNETAIGSLMRYITTPNNNFQPMNITFGLMPPLAERVRDKKMKNEMIAKRAIRAIHNSQFIIHN